MRSPIALLLLLFADHAAAMSCLPLSLEERFQSSTHVALAEVTDARIEESRDFSRALPGTSVEVEVESSRREPQWRKIVAKVRILESYKGENAPTTLTLTTWGAFPEIAVGGAFLLFLDGPEVSLDCDGMPKISAAPEDDQLIDELRALADRMPN